MQDIATTAAHEHIHFPTHITPISAHDCRDQVEGGVLRRASSVICTETAAPNGLEIGRAGISQGTPWDVAAAVGRVGDVDLEESVPEGETEGANIRPVCEAGIRLFSFCPKSQPVQLPANFIAELVVALRPRARIPQARMCVFTFRVIPTSGVPSTSSTVAARSSFRIQGKSQPEAS